MHFLPAALVATVLPVLMGAGTCGLLFDYTEKFLVTDPVDTIVIVVDNGSIDATAYQRDAILLERHTFGFESSLDTGPFTVEDGVFRDEAHCTKNDKCTFDHMFELPFGIAFDISMAHANIAIGYTDGDIDAEFDDGVFEGVRLACSRLSIAADAADIDLDFAEVPDSVEVDIDAGEVVLEVPAGEYRCALAAEHGDVTMMGITCVDTATAVLDVRIGDGDIAVRGITP